MSSLLRLYLLLLSLLFLLIAPNYCLDNGLARTPPMGWMSWTIFYCEIQCDIHPFTCINENLYMEMADRLDWVSRPSVSINDLTIFDQDKLAHQSIVLKVVDNANDGYRDAGYVGVHIDDCWMARQRNASGALVSDPDRFPSGIPSLANYMHSLGLKLGIYEDFGNATCQGYPGSLGYLKIDADTFASWNVDYLKLDGCNVDVDQMPIGYPEMSMRLNATGRPIVYSCSWPAYLEDQPEKVNYTQIGQYCNLWRNFDDIDRSWKSINKIINYYDHNQDKHIPTHGPGHWHDPDMIIVGNTEITPDQARTQMSIWSIWSAPLIMSNDLRLIAPVYRDILLNRRVIGVDQDPFGIMGRLVANASGVGVYVKPVAPYNPATLQYSYAVVLFNRNTYMVKASVGLSQIGLQNPMGYLIQDLWSGDEFGLIKPTEQITAQLPATGVFMFKATLP